MQSLPWLHVVLQSPSLPRHIYWKGACAPPPSLSSFCNPSFKCGSWKLLKAEPSITLQLPKSMNACPLRPCTLPLGWCSQLFWETLPAAGFSDPLLLVLLLSWQLLLCLLLFFHQVFKHCFPPHLCPWPSLFPCASYWMISSVSMASTITSVAGSHRYVTNSETSAPMQCVLPSWHLHLSAS